MRTLVALVVALVLALSLAACGTTDSQLLQEGHNPAYVQGFHDGRHSGMQEAGNRYETYIRDHERFENDGDYRDGWLAGESEGRRLQEQAVKFGNIAAGAYQTERVMKEADKAGDVDRAAREAVRGVDTTELDSLGK